MCQIRICRVLAILVTVQLFTICVATGYLDDRATCEPIRIQMCSHLKYNETRMPNFLGHSSQDEAIRQLTPYAKLVDVFNCSQHINFFLCSLFAPMCTQQLDGPLVIEVCRSMCLQVSQPMFFITNV